MSSTTTLTSETANRELRTCWPLARVRDVCYEARTDIGKVDEDCEKAVCGSQKCAKECSARPGRCDSLDARLPTEQRRWAVLRCAVECSAQLISFVLKRLSLDHEIRKHHFLYLELLYSVCQVTELALDLVGRFGQRILRFNDS